MPDRSQDGFTMVELLAVMSIGAILLTLSAGALRDYVRGKSLSGAHARVVTQLRNAQQRTFSEGYPKAYGVRFLKGGTRWDVVRYDAATATCTVVESHVLGDGVRISSAGSQTDFPESAAATACRSAAPNASGAYEVALFYARGTATGGTATFVLDGTSKQRTLTVNAATGRIS